MPRKKKLTEEELLELERKEEEKRKLIEQNRLRYLEDLEFIKFPTIKKVQKIIDSNSEIAKILESKGKYNKTKLFNLTEMPCFRGIKIELYSGNFKDMVKIATVFEKKNYDMIYGITQSPEKNSYYLIITRHPSYKSFYMKKEKKKINGKNQDVYLNTMTGKYYDKYKNKIEELN